MNNKTNIEEDIKILKEIQETNRAWLKETKEPNCEKIYLRDIQAIENVLADRENYKTKYDTLVEKIKEEIKELKNQCGGNVFHIQQTINAEIRLLQKLLDTIK